MRNARYISKAIVRHKAANMILSHLVVFVEPFESRSPGARTGWTGPSALEAFRVRTAPTAESVRVPRLKTRLAKVDVDPEADMHGSLLIESSGGCCAHVCFLLMQPHQAHWLAFGAILNGTLVVSERLEGLSFVGRSGRWAVGVARVRRLRGGILFVRKLRATGGGQRLRGFLPSCRRRLPAMRRTERSRRGFEVDQCLSYVQ